MMKHETFLPAAFVTQAGSVMTEGLGELCLAGPMVTTGYVAHSEAPPG